MELQHPPVVFLARQPIYDRRMNVFGYELLFRHGSAGTAGEVLREHSATTIIRAVSDIGLESLSKDRPAFINVPDYLLTDPALELLPKDRVVLEILENVEPTPENLKAAEELASKGFCLALDDFVDGAIQEQFLPHCQIVKIDLPQQGPSNLGALVRRLKRLQLKVLAEKVETTAEYSQAIAAGFDLFQGYFFAKPALVSGRQVPASGSLLVRILSLLSDPDVSMADVEDLVSADVTLAFRLLKLVNSAGLSLKPVESVRSALMVLGVERVSALVSLLVMAGMDQGSSELLTIAMVRAKMCEGVAQALGLPNPGMHFTVGLLSVIEALFGAPMEELVEQLPLAPPLKQALLDPDSAEWLGPTLKLALAFERGSWSVVDEFCEQSNSVQGAYLAAVGWATAAIAAIAA